MPIEVNVHQARSQLSRLVDRVSNGDEVIIVKDGKPVARLTPYAPPERRQPGSAAGLVTISPDFDAPLPEFGHA
jgi:prevent-host-death family protein